ncbi:hypothetical protein [Flagellimonas onchidii]|uniref:hypothetical protein n=1 Tax=Flagellimonas onchidii TaxID=2562684 RepID=UPI0010A6B0A5|nr:hypothetical protein [Allomuricauda onchidii]
MANKSIDIYIEGQRLDLFKDENITVNSSVQNLSNISKVFTDFSQSFTVPATQNNNRIFKHFYNADIDGGFDARTKKASHIEISKLPFREGKIRLESVSKKNNRPVNYKITFFGNLVNISDLFGDDQLSDLDFSEYDHTYDSLNVVNGMINGLNNRDIIYPFISATRQWYFTDSTSDSTDTEHLLNIAYHFDDGQPQHGIDWTELKPAIRARAILDKIQSTYGITFSNDFFGTAPLDDLYLWLSNSKGKLVKESSVNKINFTTHVSGDNIFNLTDDYYETTLVSSSAFSGIPNGTQRVTGQLIVTPQSSYNNVEYSTFRQDTENGTLNLMNENLTGTSTYSTFIPRIIEDGTFTRRYSFYLQSKDFMVYDVQLTIRKQQWSGTWVTIEEEVLSASSVSSTSDISISKVFSPMKVKDFFTGLIKMYNLVIVPTSSTSFYVNTLDNWYDEGSIVDITRYVDISKSDVAKGNTLSEVNFKFKEDDTILIDKFSQINGYQYGNLETVLKDANGNKLDGKPLNVEVGFGNMVFERLPDISTGNLTNIQYGTAIGSDQSPKNPKPLLFYAIRTTLSNSVGIRTSSNSLQGSTTAFLPSHVNDFTTKEYSTVFNTELDEYDSTLIENSLYKLYYEDYVTDIFSQKRRKYSYTAKLPQHLISTLKLNDRLLIKDTRYIINNMEINLTTGTVQLDLLNDIYQFVSDNPLLTDTVMLSYDVIDAQDCCLEFGSSVPFSTRPYAIPQGESFASATQLYKDSDGELATLGWYSNGVVVRRWNGTSFIETQNCA